MDDDIALRFGNVTLDLDRYRAVVEGRQVQLTFMEFEILEEFLRAADRVVSTDEAASHVLARTGRQLAGDAAVKHVVMGLRQKLGPESQCVIETVRKRGYRLRLRD